MLIPYTRARTLSSLNVLECARLFGIVIMAINQIS